MWSCLWSAAAGRERPPFSFLKHRPLRPRASQPACAMSKKVDCSFMKFVTTNAEWQKEVQDGGSKVLCSAFTH